MIHSAYLSRLINLLVTVIALSVLYSFVSPSLSPIRTFLALVQFGFMAFIMVEAVQHVLEDY